MSTRLCPICRKPLPEEPPPPGQRSYAPFCSDLGRWLDGKYQIPVEPDDLDEQAGLDAVPPEEEP
jgi:endogenous inhibitor of DNA gyrase (YacG/DUF329 family)